MFFLYDHIPTAGCKGSRMASKFTDEPGMGINIPYLVMNEA